MEKTPNNIIIGILSVAVIVLLFANYIPKGHSPMMAEEREDFISLKTDIQSNLLADGNYRCCLKKPCTYCIEKTPGHGEEATCNCLEDVVNGRHPCGECIGEILEGHGNPYLKEYFAVAIAEEVGEEHLETLQKIIDEKYP